MAETNADTDTQSQPPAGRGSSLEALGQNETARWRVESGPGADPHELHSRLVLDRAEAASNGLYECEATALEGATNGEPAHQADRLRRLFGLVVNGKYRVGIPASGQARG